MRCNGLSWSVWPIIFLMTGLLGAQSQPTLQEIKTSLSCLCDCNMIVEACEGSMACTSADNLTAEAQKLIDQGMNKEAILARFVSRYGEHILSAPTKKGFNLTAWITPFAAILIAAFLIVHILRTWSRVQRKHMNGMRNEPNSSDGRYEKQIDDVLRALD